MKLQDLTSGVYRLPEPVDNPKPDGRRPSDWRCSQRFSAGRYIVRAYESVDTYEISEERKDDGRQNRREHPLRLRALPCARCPLLATTAPSRPQYG